MIDTFDGLIWVDAVRQCPVLETCWLIAARWLQSELHFDPGPRGWPIWSRNNAHAAGNSIKSVSASRWQTSN